MKKILLFGFICVLMTSLVLAQGQGIHEPGTGVENPELREAGQGTGQGLQATEEVQGAGEGQRIKARAGDYLNHEGRQMKIYRQANNRLRLEVGKVSADSLPNLTQERMQNRTRLYTGLSNGRNAEIKVMPDTASETALQRLRLRNCNEDCVIELKEVGVRNQTRFAYEVRTQRNSKVLGLFGARMKVNAQVDAETGKMIKVNKPWWAFLATEPEE
ncbi:hypothetical protein ACFL6I_09570 [candidate division KSB1 bacterium]